MKKILYFCSVFLLRVASDSFAQSKIDYSGFNVVFEDNFNYASTAQLAPKWTTVSNVDRIGDTRFCIDQVSLVNDPDDQTNKFLRFNAVTPVPAQSSPSCSISNAVRNYQSGAIYSTDEFLYGIIEARLRIPVGPSFPSFWMNRWTAVRNPVDYTRTEIDILEADGSARYTNNVHYWQRPDTPGDYDSYLHKACQTGQVLTVGGLDEFHTYTLYWSPDKITFFFDGREVRTVTDPDLVTLRNPCNIIAMLAMPGYPGDFDYYNQHPGYAKMDIDWVRVLKPVSGDTPADYAATPYKTESEWMHAKVESNTSVPTSVLPTYGSITTGSVSPYTGSYSNEVYYADEAGKLRSAYRNPNGDVWYDSYVAYTFGTSLPGGQVGDDLITGDLVYNAAADLLVYKGHDGRLQYLKKGSTWTHGWIDSNTASTASIVSSTPGSVAVGDDGSVFFKAPATSGIANIRRFAPGPLRRYYLSGSAWVYDAVPYTYATNELVAGDVTVGSGNQVYYRNSAGVLHTLYPCNNAYCHTTIDNTGAYPASTNPGSITIRKGGLNSQYLGDFIFYVGADKQIHQFYGNATVYGTSPASWTHLQLTTSTGDALARGPIKYNYTIVYGGVDGRIQALENPCKGFCWVHRWIDDYVNTNVYQTYDSTQLTSSPNICLPDYKTIFYRTGVKETTSSTDYFPNPNLNKLGYFAYRTAEVELPCGTYSNVQTRTALQNTTGPAKGQKLGLTLVPNPSEAAVELQYGKSTQSMLLSYVVLDLFGQVKLQGVAKNHSSIQVAGLPSGMYIVSVTVNGEQYQSRLVKR